MDKDISLAEDFYEFQKKEWMAFRVFWVLMAGVLLAAAFGLFGKGLLSDKTVTHNGIRFEYNKFMRVEKGTELLVGVAQGGRISEVSFNNEYIKKVKIDQVIPQPASVEVRDNKVIYRFSSVQNGFITFYLIPYKVGSQPLEVTVGEARLQANQFVYF